MKNTKIRRPGRLKAITGAIGEWLGRTIKLTDSDFWASWLRGLNFSGQRVSVDSTLQLSTAWACVRLIAETLATLPCGVLKDQADGSKKTAKDHQLHYLLHTQPNARMTAVDFWTVVVAAMLLQGNAYVEKRMGGADTLIALEPLVPERVTKVKTATGYEWRYNDPDTRTVRVIPDARMWHIPAFGLTGTKGLSPISMGANVFGGAIAADKASAETFTNGLKSPGVVSMPDIKTEKQRDQMRAHVEKVNREGGFMVLEGASGFHQLRMNPQDAELLSTRKHNIEEICRWFRVWPGLVGHSSNGQTMWGSGVEQMLISFVVFCLRPWAVRIEQSARIALFNPVERLTHSVAFNLEGLMRGDSAARAAFYSQMVQNGVMTRDDCRAKENLPAMGGNAGVLTVQTNLVPIDQLGKTNAASDAQNVLKQWLGVTEKEGTNS